MAKNRKPHSMKAYSKVISKETCAYVCACAGLYVIFLPGREGSKILNVTDLKYTCSLSVSDL